MRAVDDLTRAESARDPAGLFEPEVLEAARGLYDASLPYHHFGHALRAVAAGERLVAACTAAGKHVVADVVRHALLFHDAGYGTDPTEAGCASAEDYSATLARRALTGAVPEPRLAEIESAILATRQSTVPGTLEGQVVRAADLAELAADFETFRANSEALRAELEQLTGARMPTEQWRSCCASVVGGYLDEPLWPVSLPDATADPRGFHAAARDNLDRYLSELEASAHAASPDAEFGRSRLPR
jgi:predicted metal-dependent HD superfamily phosphohydrolase